MTPRPRRTRVKESAALPLSLARGRLFELAEDMLTYRADRVALSHKDYDDQLVLVRASDLAKMDADIAALRERAGIEPQPLRGLMRLNVAPDDVLVEARREQAELWEAKLKSLSAPHEGADGDE
jgi:hypothetical protein